MQNVIRYQGFCSLSPLNFYWQPTGRKTEPTLGPVYRLIWDYLCWRAAKKTPQNPGNNCFFNHTKILNKKVIFTDKFMRNYIVHSVK